MSTTPAPASAIADVTYRNYNGELRTRALRWWIITVATIRANVNRKKYGFWIPVVLSFLIYFFLGIVFYLRNGLSERVAESGNVLPGSDVNQYTLTLYQGLTSTSLLVVIAAMTVGSAVIAADNRANALLVYLSKPLTRIDYLIGKWMGIFLLLAAMTLTPALLLYLFFLVAYNGDGFLKQNPMLIFQVIGVSLLPAALHASVMLGFSAWSKTPRLAGALYAALYFVSGILAGTIGSVLLEKNKDSDKPQPMTAIVSNLSLGGVTEGIAMNVYNVTPQQVVARMQNGGRRRRRNRDKEEAPAPPSVLPERPKLPIMLLFGGVVIAVPLAAAYVKVRAVEVVRG